MDTVASLLKLSHVALAMALVAGIIGRWLTRFEAALRDARSSGVVTDELRGAFADGRVRAARTFEMGGIGIIVALMVLKPL